MRNIFVFLLLSMTLSACGQNDKSIVAEELMHHRFTIIKWNNEEIKLDPSEFIEFGENLTINGKMCNDFSGQLILQNNQIKAPDLVMDSVICNNSQLNQLDGAIKKLLQHGAKIERITQTNNQFLQLSDEDTTLVLEKKDLM
ncbi:META domain-containing protein [Orbus mooreae]|uniref:META domain-containing protein n=1 Tax=Orbus mooreae TaxID=3074107 RepID=UPI00370D0EC2